MRAIKRIHNKLQKKRVGYIPIKTGRIYTYINAGVYEKGARRVIIINNPRARNPTFAQLLDFLEKDKTDMMMYVPGNFMCGDFAMRIHNNAEEKGIRCGLARVYFESDNSTHACNAFNTTDKGLIFTDSAGETEFENYAEYNCYDAFARIVKGKPLFCRSIDGNRLYLIEEKNVKFTRVYW